MRGAPCEVSVACRTRRDIRTGARDVTGTANPGGILVSLLINGGCPRVPRYFEI